MRSLVSALVVFLAASLAFAQSQPARTRPRTGTRAPTATASAAPSSSPPPASSAPPPSAAPSSAPSTAPGGFAMRNLDLATVRIFGIRGISGERVVGRTTRASRVIAVPDAGHGSGVAIDRRGLILTARHVIRDVDILAVVRPGETRAIPARVVYEHPTHDLALIFVDEPLQNIVPIPASDPPLRVTQHVSATGYPLDSTERFPAAASGEISRQNNDGRLQLAMSLNPGNSGGPIVDDNENLVGIAAEGADPTHGAQGIVIAEPLANIRATRDGYFDWLVSAARNAPTSSAPPTNTAATSSSSPWMTPSEASSPPPPAQNAPTVSLAEADREIAQFAVDLINAGEFGLVFDNAMHNRLVELAARRPRANVLVLLAAHAWNQLMVLMENNHAQEPEYLPPAVHDDAERLIQTMVQLCRRAVREDPRIVDRYPFANVVIQADDRVRARQIQETPPEACGSVGTHCCENNFCGSNANCVDGTCEAAVTCHVDRDCNAREECTEGACRPRRGPRRFVLGFGLGLHVETVPNTPVMGFGAANIAFAGRPLVFGTRKPWQLSLVVGAEARIGSWRSNLLIDGLADIGAQFTLGERIGVTATLLYTPGVIGAESRVDGVYRAYRIMLALQVRRFAFGLDWSEIGRGANQPYRNLGLVFTVDL